jgi:hypothetical protein
MGKSLPENVELILEINKTVIVASSWSSIFTLPKLNISFVVDLSVQVAMGGVTQTMVFSVFTHCSVICVF